MPGIMSEGSGGDFVPRCEALPGNRLPHRDASGRPQS
jgi:hypothetical protein